MGLCRVGTCFFCLLTARKYELIIVIYFGWKLIEPKAPRQQLVEIIKNPHKLNFQVIADNGWMEEKGIVRLRLCASVFLSLLSPLSWTPSDLPACSQSAPQAPSAPGSPPLWAPGAGSTQPCFSSDDLPCFHECSKTYCICIMTRGGIYGDI